MVGEENQQDLGQHALSHHALSQSASSLGIISSLATSGVSMPQDSFLEFSQSSGDLYQLGGQQYRPTAVLASGGMLLNAEELEYLERFLCSISPAEMTKGLPELQPASQENPATGTTTATTRRNSQPKAIRAKTAPAPILVRPQPTPFPGPGGPSAALHPFLEVRKTDADTKRAHHIASEHKRRFRIRTELMRLNDLVPGLVPSSQQNSAAAASATTAAGKNSQSKILQAAADYLERVVQENARLRAEVEAMRNQMMRPM